MERPIILCVDDERVILDTLATQLETHLGNQFEYETANGGEEAIELVQSILDSGQEVAVVISDQMMPYMQGDEVLTRIHEISPATKKILLTGQAGGDAVGRALNNANLYRYVAKPWDKTDLMLTVEEAAKSFLNVRTINQQNSILESLYFASTTLGRENTTDGMVQKLIEIVMDHSDAERVAIIRMKDGKLLSPVVYKICYERVLEGKLPPFLPDENIEICNLIVRESLNAGHPINISNCNIHPWGTDDYVKKNRLKSAFAIPMILDEKIEGIFYFEHYKQYAAFGKECLEFMKLFVKQAAISLDSAELYASLEQKVADRTVEISNQKTIIEEKSKDLEDSMIYAARLQDALLSGTDAFYNFFPDSMIWLRGKDMISGDFYWYHIKGDLIYFAVVDCTGHGVPGGLISVLAANILSDIITHEEASEPGQILTLLHTSFSEKLKHSQGPQLLDGMDLALCKYDRSTGKLNYSGAQRPLFFLRKGELTEMRSDKFSIGGHTPPNYTFHDEVLDTQKGDLIFAFSDGITDQMNGTEPKKKFGYKSLREILSENQQLPVSQIVNLLQKRFENWKQNEPQTDDILFMGVRL